MKNLPYVAAAAAAMLLSPLRAMASDADDCQNLASLKLESTKILSAQITGPEFKSEPNALSPTAVSPRKQFCRVTGVISPAIQFEVWLPLKADWNGKFQGVGNGGMAGLIGYGGLRGGMESGSVAVASDLGHVGDTRDASFAIGDPQKVVDWGHRATHEMTVKGKALATAFYGSGPRYSYFSGCSGGGRQGVVEAQRYPEDYNGITAGNPTINFTNLAVGGRLWGQLVTGGAGYIPNAKAPAIAAAVNAACDGLDGVKDGVLEDPRQCKFQPASMKCTGEDKNDCLTGPQVTALEKFYGGAKTSSGKQIYPGYERGGEISGWSLISGTEPRQSPQWGYATAYLKGMAFENPEYDPMTFNYDKDVEPMNRRKILGEPLADVVNGMNPDLRPFKKAGGKLIVSHGWNDPTVAPQATIDYFEKVVEVFAKEAGGKAAALRETQEAFRLFLVPGLHHCSGGPGATSFDMGDAVEKWVEEGTPPAQVIASKSAGRNAGVERTHPLCPYPQKAHFTGKGDGKNAADFVCK